MSDFARVDSIDVIRDFRAALWKFAEVAQVALGDAESELTRTLMWLETEQSSYWAGQVRKRQELVSRAAEKLREKRLFKDATGRLPSAVDEEKAWKVARAKLEEAEAKIVLVRKYAGAVQKAIHDYKGSTQQFQTAIAHDIPVAVARLDKLGGLLRQYVELAPVGPAAETTASTAGGSMGRHTNAPPAEPAAADAAGAVPDLPDFPAFDPPAVVLVHTHRPTGLVLAADGKAPAEDGNQYRPFASRAEAGQYAQAKVATDPQVACAIYGADRTELVVVTNSPATSDR